MTTLARAAHHLEAIRRTPASAIDAALFAGSAVFAALLWAISDLSPHRDWARDSIIGYAVCSVLALVIWALRPRRELLCRALLSTLCFVIVVLLPMSLMVRDRSRSAQERHVLPEVAVIERAGRLLVDHQDPYVAYVTGSTLIGQVPGVPRYESFYPYFPAMTAFGLPSTIEALGALGDARLWMALVTVGLLIVALLLARPPPGRSLRAAQVMCVLPTGAVFLAGGGDDLPILAMSLVGIVLVARRQSLGSGAVFGLAMAMKLTAWPLAALSLFVVRQQEGSRAAARAAAVMGAIVAVFVIPFAVWDPRTFLANTLEFPLGVAGVDSPAASPLPGHVIVSLLPATHRALLVGLLALGGPILLWHLWRRPPRDVAAVCRLTAIIAIVVMCVAPATRIGYLVYPVNLLVWSWLLAPVTDSSAGDTLAPTAVAELPDADQVRSDAWNSR